ncbi:hypothetical protein FNV43_RR09167 [Rhamnella rubrinervis]|uniref:YTH domain-containing family protein n=1 Tax=Rhamnella rubrinervis TaxID=2594499 RepID=A0A8K0HAQ5_9ROSA|nr:hypothetical protein FNV43_RR09167 [Rhamnella rubrinervis]
MSSDTARENASVVDSSLTEWKQDVRNSEDPESSSYKANDDGDPSREDFRNFRGHSTANRKGKLHNTRYFIIKSLNRQNIQLSIERGIWATQVMNEPILEEAFHNSGRVILIFSINMSGFFQGYAEMMSSVGWRRDNVWSQGNGKCNPWGRSFKVKWLQLNDLPFQRTLHLKNPLNDYKPVKISRDCQELSPDIGEALCELLDGKSDVDGLHRDEFPSKRPLGDEEYNVPPAHLSWSQAPMLYSSLLYQHQAGASTYQFAHQRTSDSDVSSQFDAWGLAGDSPLASALTEDDFLEMSYEEYLEAHSRSSKQLCLPASGPSLSTQDSSRSKKQDADFVEIGLDIGMH